MGGISGSTVRALCVALLLCGCSSQATYWEVGLVPAHGRDTIEMPRQDGGTLGVKRERLLALRTVVQHLAVAAGVRLDHLVLTDELGLNARAGRTAAGRAFIVVTVGMLDFLGDDVDQVAGLLGHEIGHLALKHRDAVATDPRAQSDAMIFSRILERQADDFGVRVAFAAGYDPEGSLRLNRRVQELVSRARFIVPYAKTHPSFLEREADLFRLVSGYTAAARQSKVLELWSHIGLGLEQQGDGLVVTRIGAKSWGSLAAGDRIVALESPVRAPVAHIDDILKAVSPDAGVQSFRFSVLRQGSETPAYFHFRKPR
jgi:hypothetical protein